MSIIRTVTASVDEHDNAIAASQDAAEHLRAGRYLEALMVLEQLPVLIRTALEEAIAFGRATANALEDQVPDHKPAPTGNLDRLRSLCATPEGRARACTGLALEDAHLEAVLAGRVTLAPTMWRRLWSTVA